MWCKKVRYLQEGQCREHLGWRVKSSKNTKKHWNYGINALVYMLRKRLGLSLRITLGLSHVVQKLMSFTTFFLSFFFDFNSMKGKIIFLSRVLWFVLWQFRARLICKMEDFKGCTLDPPILIQTCMCCLIWNLFFFFLKINIIGFSIFEYLLFLWTIF